MLNCFKPTSFKYYVSAACAVLLLSACGESDDVQPSDNTLSIDMRLPDSMTGGKGSPILNNMLTLNAASAVRMAQSSDVPCEYIGGDQDDPFRNGYEMTKFMVSVVATWSCISDNVIRISASLPHGEVVETDNDILASNYDAEEPTHYRVIDDTESQVSVYLYYGFSRDVPPTSEDMAGIYFSWDESSSTDVQGKLVIDISGLSKENIDPEDPIKMRMDFTNDASQKLANMYLQFDQGNPWADGFRVEVSKDLTAAGPQVFTAKGLLSMSAQFLPVADITELPQLKMFTVSDAFGEGAAIAEYTDVSLPLELTPSNHMGNYIFSKQDIYFFDGDQSTTEPWDWIEKTITSSEYRLGRTTPATGGTWVNPFDPSLDMIIEALQLDTNYFTGTACANEGDDCTAFLNAVFVDGFAEQEQNQGANPDDWRSDAINVNATDYLDTVYPVGHSDWSMVFEFSFTPAF